MLSNEKKAFFRKLLTEKLNMLFAEADTFSEFHKYKDISSDLVDQALAESEADFGFHLKEREGRLITKIKDALERLEEGYFDVCDECGGKISEERLEARPVTTHCIECKKRQEAEERVRGL
jgi:DnaK suppressor protein